MSEIIMTFRSNKACALWFALLGACAGTIEDGAVSDGRDTLPPSQGAERTRPGPEPAGQAPVATPRGPDVPLPGRAAGQASLHRLNRAEYNNTVRDLLGTETRPANNFAPDSSSFGFDHISSVQNTSILHAEQFLGAAERLINEALAKGSTPSATLHFDVDEPAVEKLPGQDNRDLIKKLPGGFWQIGGSDEMRTTLRLPADGEYELSVFADGIRTVFADFSLDEQAVASVRVNMVPGTYKVNARLQAGLHVLAIGAHEGACDPKANLNCGGLMKLKSFEVIGPLGGAAGAENPARKKLLTCSLMDTKVGGSACTDQIIKNFASRAWRRPVVKSETDGLRALFDSATKVGADDEEALKTTLKAVLLSPYFLYRFEAPPASGRPARRLDDYELASKLSYFLWSSMPDDRLFDAASRRMLGDTKILQAELERMLQDKKASALVENFAGQWLSTRAIDAIEKDKQSYPTFDLELRTSMRRETELFYRTFLDEPRSALELLTSQETFVNNRLRSHYGLPSGGDDGFVRTRLDGSQRSGLLGQAGLLAVLANPKSTAAVGRGKWVLTRLMCQPVPPPPPGQNVELPAVDLKKPATMRQLLQKHVVNPSCTSCHSLLDPIGLALEHFDAVGAWRDTDKGAPIDSKGSLPGGVRFDGSVELAKAIAADPSFAKCLVNNLYIYAMAEGPDGTDQATIAGLAEGFTAVGHKMPWLVSAIVASDMFRSRRPDGD